MATNTLAENVTQAISDFANIKTAIEAKGVTVPSGTPTSDYNSLIGDIPTGDDSALKGMIDGTTSFSLQIPYGVTAIRRGAFQYTKITSVFIPDTVTGIGSDAFYNCANLASANIPNGITELKSRLFEGSALTQITIPNSVVYIRDSAFDNCHSLTSLTIPNGVTYIGDFCFQYCTSLSTLTIPSSITTMTSSAFAGCSALVNVTLENGFNANYLKLSYSTLYTAETIVSWLNALADRTGETAYTLYIGTTNKNKMTAEEIAIATNKNWNIA